MATQKDNSRFEITADGKLVESEDAEQKFALEFDEDAE